MLIICMVYFSSWPRDMQEVHWFVGLHIDLVLLTGQARIKPELEKTIEYVVLKKTSSHFSFFLILGV